MMAAEKRVWVNSVLENMELEVCQVGSLLYWTGGQVPQFVASGADPVALHRSSQFQQSAVCWRCASLVSVGSRQAGWLCCSVPAAAHQLRSTLPCTHSQCAAHSDWR